MESNFGAAEAERLKEIREHREREARAKNWENRKERLAQGTRRTVKLFFVLAIVALAFNYREDLQQLVSMKVRQMAVRHASAPPGALRQSVAGHQNELDQITQ